uniref:Uncharacterized protein n=1 Tax=Rhizophora mucronata TaxID=61149 RepID=A0A2P2NZC1_RHIMU
MVNVSRINTKTRRFDLLAKMDVRSQSAGLKNISVHEQSEWPC